MNFEYFDIETLAEFGMDRFGIEVLSVETDQGGIHTPAVRSFPLHDPDVERDVALMLSDQMEGDGSITAVIHHTGGIIDGGINDPALPFVLKRGRDNYFKKLEVMFAENILDLLSKLMALLALTSPKEFDILKHVEIVAICPNKCFSLENPFQQPSETDDQTIHFPIPGAYCELPERFRTAFNSSRVARFWSLLHTAVVQIACSMLKQRDPEQEEREREAFHARIRANQESLLRQLVKLNRPTD